MTRLDTVSHSMQGNKEINLQPSVVPQDRDDPTNPKVSNADSAKHNWPNLVEREHQIKLLLWKTQSLSQPNFVAMYDWGFPSLGK